MSERKCVFKFSLKIGFNAFISLGGRISFSSVLGACVYCIKTVPLCCIPLGLPFPMGEGKAAYSQVNNMNCCSLSLSVELHAFALASSEHVQKTLQLVRRKLQSACGFRT